MKFYDYIAALIVADIMTYILFNILSSETMFSMIYSSLAFIGWFLIWGYYENFRKNMIKKKE